MATKKKAEVKQDEVAVAVPKAKTPGGMRIIEMYVENIKRISCVRIKPKGSTIVISGENGSGKSSVLDAIAFGILGTGSIPSQPIKSGKVQGRVQLMVGGETVQYNIERTFTHTPTAKNPILTKLTIFNADFSMEYKTPQAVLEKLMGAISFDPLEFIRMEAKKQLETLRKLVTFKVDIDKLEEEKAIAYNQRRDAGRDLDGVLARFTPMVAPDPELPAESIDLAALQLQLTQAAEHNAAIERAKAKKGQLATRILELSNRANELRKEAALALANAHLLDGLNVKMSALSPMAVPPEANATGLSQVQQLLKEKDAIEIGTPIDTAAVSAELTRGQTMNFAIQSRDIYNSVRNEAAAAEAEWKRLDELVKAKTKEREEAIAEAKMPIEGLGIGDGEVVYQGLPFNQASNAEQIRVSVALAIACNSTLRVLRIKDGSLLDDKSMEMIRTMAEDGDYQVWIERVAGDGKVGIMMVDGEASGEEAVTV